MIEFKKPNIDDIEILRPYFNYSRSNSSENSVGSFLIWADYLDTKYSIFEKTLIISINIDGYGETFLVPIGENVNKAILEIKKYTDNKKMCLIFSDVTEKDMEVIDGLYSLEKKLIPEWADYVYNAPDLMNFSGRKYHGQKNHVNYFKKTYTNFSFKKFEQSDVDALKIFINEFKLQNEAGSKFFDEEIEKCIWAIENNDKLKFKGLLLKVDNKIIGFSLGEIVKDTLYIHFEKANKMYRGAYPTLVSEFAKTYAMDLLYLNREDSACDKGLKESKMQYHPCYLIDKYIAKVINNK